MPNSAASSTICFLEIYLLTYYIFPLPLNVTYDSHGGFSSLEIYGLDEIWSQSQKNNRQMQKISCLYQTFAQFKELTHESHSKMGFIEKKMFEQ